MSRSAYVAGYVAYVAHGSSCVPVPHAMLLDIAPVPGVAFMSADDDLHPDEPTDDEDEEDGVGDDYDGYVGYVEEESEEDDDEMADEQEVPLSQHEQARRAAFRARGARARVRLQGERCHEATTRYVGNVAVGHGEAMADYAMQSKARCHPKLNFQCLCVC